MRTAIFSDVHGDEVRLLLVLADIAAWGCDRVLCLGDVVNGGESNEAVVRHLQASSVVCVRGNHDEHPSAPLDIASRDWLRLRPEEIIENQVIYTHASPRVKKHKIKTDFDVWNAFDDVSYRRIFIGDVHIPMLWGEKCVTPISSTRYAMIYDQPLALARDDRYLICVGAVHRSRDADGRPRYAIYDDEEDVVLFRAVSL